MLNKISTNKNTHKLLLSFLLFISVFFFANSASAGTFSALIPEIPVTSCGEISLAGNYTLNPTFDADSLNADGTCFVINAYQINGGTVTIDGNGQTVATTTGTLAVDVRARDVGGDNSLVDGASPSATNITIQNITFSGFTNGINASGNASTNGEGGAGGNISILSSTVGSIYTDGGSGTTVGGIAGDVSVSSNSIVGEISSVGGHSYTSFEAQNAGSQWWISITSTPNGDVYVVDNDNGDIYKQTAGTGAFVAQNAGNKIWTSITSTPNGDVYAVVNNGDIYKQTAGTGSFVAQGAGSQYWKSITSTPSGDVYAVAYNDDIYKQTAGTGSFVAQGAGSQWWLSITSTPNGDVYAVDNDNGDIYKQTAGTGSFVAQGVGSERWKSITSTPSGDVYAVDGYYGDIYKQSAGTGSFVAQGAGSREWYSITSTPNGDVYASVWGGDIYKQTAGTGAFVAQGAGSQWWISITSTPNGDVYVVVNGGDIYKSSILHAAGGSVTVSDSQTEDIDAGSGSITISGDDLDISNNTYTADSVSFTHTGTLTTTNTYISAVSHFIFSGTDYGPYTGDFPTTFPGSIDSCVTIVLPGTYILSNSISDISGTCFTVRSDNVVIDGGQYSVTAQGGNDSYAVVATSSLGGGSAYTNITIQNITFSGFTNGINASGNASTNGEGGAGGNISILSSTVGSINTNGGSGTTVGGIAGDVSVSSNSIVGEISSVGGFYSYTSFEAQNAGSQSWQSITSTPNGDVYAVVNGGDIYKQAAGTESFVSQASSLGNKNWQSITSTPNGDVYAVWTNWNGNGGIYKQTGGTGAFVAQNAGSQNLQCLTSTPSGDVYAGAYGGDIYKQTAGTGSFVAQGAGSQAWQSITSTPNGDVYAVVSDGDIYKQTGGTGAFVAQNAGSQTWLSITSTPNGDVYASGSPGGIYKQTGGTGAFVTQGVGIQYWQSITSTPNGDVYTVVYGGDIYKQTAGTGAFVAQNAGNKIWTSITSTPNGDVYAVDGDYGDIYKSSALYATGGSITVSDSQTGDIDAGSGSITISADDLDISNNTYTASVAIVIDSAVLLTTNSSTYIYSGTGSFMVNGYSYAYPGIGPGYNGVYNPIIYYFSNVTDTDWNTLDNWCTGAFCGQGGSTASLLLPTQADQVIVDGDILSNSGDIAVADTVVINGSSINAISIYAVRGVTYDASSTNVGTSTIPIVNFNDTSENTGTIYTRVATFYNDLSSTILGKIKGIASGAFIAQNAGSQGWQSITSTPNGDVYAGAYGGDIYKQTAGTGDFVAQGAGSRGWYSITSTPNGDVYASVWSGDIYKQTAGTGNFAAQNAGSQWWSSITSTPNGDVYAVVWSGDIYKQTAGIGAFVAQGVGNLDWSSITSTPSGDVYAAVSDGDMYKQTGGTGAFVTQGVGSLDWYSITSTPNGDVYAAVADGDIYKQTGGTGNFVALDQTSRSWYGITSTPSGDVYATVIGGEVYKQTAGTGSFVAQNAGSLDWTSITSTPNGDVYAVVYGGDIYKQTAQPILQRIYTESATTTRVFASTTDAGGEGGQSNWIVIAQRAVGSLVEVVVDITGAFYDLTKNIFKAFTGARFISGTDINGLTTEVVPTISNSLPTEGETVIKWLPSVDWGVSTTCEYSYDNWTSSTTANCELNGADIERPEGGENTLTIRSTNQYGSFSENAINFTYDNTSPVWTSCGSDLLDEATRSYYYLATSTSNTCTATVDTKLFGNIYTTESTVSGTGFSIGAFVGGGNDITLKNLIVTATSTSNGGTITIQNATTSDIVTTATTSGTSAGSITIATSTTGTLYANGANGTADGGDGGNITITNSIGTNASSTPIFANGGSSTSCGNGGDAGLVTLTNSTYGTITANGGSANETGCPGSGKTSGQSRTVGNGITVSGSYTPPGSGNTSGNTGGSTNTNGRSSSRSVIKNTASPITSIPVQPFIPVETNLIPQNIGEKIIPAPFQNFKPTESLDLIQSPAPLQTPTEEVSGLFIIKSGEQTLTSYTTYDKAVGGLAQLVKVSPNQSLTLSLIPQSTGEVTATYLDQTLTFTYISPYATIHITAPSSAGRYVFKSSSSPIPLIIEVSTPTQTSEKKPWEMFNLPLIALPVALLVLLFLAFFWIYRRFRNKSDMA